MIVMQNMLGQALGQDSVAKAIQTVDEAARRAKERATEARRRKAEQKAQREALRGAIAEQCSEYRSIAVGKMAWFTYVDSCGRPVARLRPSNHPLQPGIALHSSDAHKTASAALDAVNPAWIEKIRAYHDRPVHKKAKLQRVESADDGGMPWSLRFNERDYLHGDGRSATRQWRKAISFGTREEAEAFRRGLGASALYMTPARLPEPKATSATSRSKQDEDAIGEPDVPEAEHEVN